MRALLARVFFVSLPLVFVVLLQVDALLLLYAGELSGKDDTMIDLGAHVQALRWGWPILLAIATAYHLLNRRVS